MSARHYDLRWLAIIGLIWASLWGWSLVSPTWWFDPQEIRFADTVEGVPPAMSYQRDIHQAFHGEWVVTVDRMEERGGFSMFCRANGVTDYSPQMVLPAKPDLDWWTWPTVCKLPPGRYKVRTFWIINIPWFPSKEIRVESNVFSVRLKPDPLPTS